MTRKLYLLRKLNIKLLGDLLMQAAIYGLVGFLFYHTLVKKENRRKSS